MGSPDFAVPALRAVASRHRVACVYTQPPRPAGRGQAARPTAVHEAAATLGLEVRSPASLKGAETQEAFAALSADVAVVVAYGLILPQAVLDAPARGCLNIHASLLPRWRGAAPIHRAVLAGDAETGVCIMRMEAGLDTGPVLLRRAVPIGPADTSGDLHDRLADLGAEMIMQALAASDLPAAPQEAEGVTYAAKIAKAEARIDWTRSAAEVARRINGLSPAPGAWTMAGAERLKLLRATAGPGDGAPGQVTGDGTIACGTGAVAVATAQREGRRAAPWAELLRGWTPPRLA